MKEHHTEEDKTFTNYKPDSGSVSRTQKMIQKDEHQEKYTQL